MNKPITTWSRKHNACIDCGTNVRQHKSGGRCTICYDRQRRGSERTEPFSMQPLPEGIWSRNYAKCRDCGTTERPHCCSGLCKKCRIARRNLGRPALLKQRNENLFRAMQAKIAAFAPPEPIRYEDVK